MRREVASLPLRPRQPRSFAINGAGHSCLLQWPVGSRAFRTAVAGEECHVSERTLVLVKPDAVRRGLVGEVLARFERKGLVIVAAEFRSVDGDTADQHYAEHVAKA